MSLPELGAVVLLAVAAELGRRLAAPSKNPHHRPVAFSLAVLLALDVGLELLHVLVLAPARARLGTAPYDGSARAAFHATQAIRFAFPGVSLVLGAHVLAPTAWRRGLILAVAVAWGLLSASVVLRYPALRGSPLLAFYGYVQLATAAAGLGLAVGYLGRVASGQAWPSPAQRCALVLVVGDLSALVGPYLIPTRAPGDWWLAHVINLICYGLLVVEQGRTLWGSSTPVRISGARSLSSASSRR